MVHRNGVLIELFRRRHTIDLDGIFCFMPMAAQCEPKLNYWALSIENPTVLIRLTQENHEISDR
jgi:hypothetical protein